MSDIIRMARAAYGPAYDQMAAEAGRIKDEYVRAGGNPLHVYSPERVQAYMDGGMGALESAAPLPRQDGSIAGPYVPPEMALANNMIEKRALPAVLAALADGIHTVSSGVDEQTGNGFAIGRAPGGEVVRVER